METSIRFEADTREQIKDSLARILTPQNYNLDKLFEDIKASLIYNANAINEFVESSDYVIDEVSFYHLSKRNINDFSKEGKNLISLLTGKNYFSEYLLKNDISFEYDKNSDYIHIIYRGKEVDLDTYNGSTRRGTIARLKDRFGINNLKDYSFNGFIFADNIKNSEGSYYNLLKNGAELLQDIEDLLHLNGLCDNYYYKAKFYCYKYVVPIEDITLLNRSDLSVQEVTQIIISNALENILGSNKNIRIGYSNYRDLSDEFFQKRWSLD